MAGTLKDSLEELRAAWEKIPEDKRAAAAEQATTAALMAGDALRILQDHVPHLAAPATASAVKAFTAHSLWKVPLPEIVGLLEAIFPAMVTALKGVAHALGFDGDHHPAPAGLVSAPPPPDEARDPKLTTP